MNWLSIHFYPVETQDVFLTRALKPFLEQYIWPHPDARAFYIRYQDEKGPHIRIRMRGAEDWLQEMVLPAFEGWFSGRGPWEAVDYVPEAERFGGASALAWAEEYFHVSTRVVLDRIARDQFTYGDAMFDALRLHIITAVGAGLTRERTRWYFEQLFDQWLPLFLPPDGPDGPVDYRSAFEQALAPQQAQVSATLDAFWNALSMEKFDSRQPEWLRWLRGNELMLKGLENDMEKALPSLLHLTNNRLGINNQDEVYLNFILSKAL